MSDEPGLMEKQFIGYMIMCHGREGYHALPEVQINETRQAYYAGAAMYQGQVLMQMGAPGALTAKEEADCAKVIDQYMAEIETFSEGRLAELMQTAGSA